MNGDIFSASKSSSAALQISADEKMNGNIFSASTSSSDALKINLSAAGCRDH